MAAFVLLPSTPGFCQPFGLRMGDSVSQVRARGILLQPTSIRYTYNTESLPEGNVRFDGYTLIIAPRSGLCSVIGWKHGIIDTPAGNATRVEYDSLFRALTAKYGDSRSYDFLSSGSILDKPDQWMISLKKGERVMRSEWSEKRGSLLPQNLRTILLIAFARSASEGIISVAYAMRNIDDCISEMRPPIEQNL